MNQPILEQRVKSQFLESARLKQQISETFAPLVVKTAERFAATLSEGRRIFSCGNGGSAADSQHFIAELVGRFEVERPGLAAISLTTDTSILTAVGNDYGYEQVFSRQVAALGQQGDCLVAISTSGNSANVIAAIEVAQQRGMSVVALSGRDGGKFNQVLGNDAFHFIVPHNSTARIQEVHHLLLHSLCDILDQLLHRS